MSATSRTCTACAATSRLRRYAAPMVEIGEELQKLNFPFIDKNMRPYFRDVQIHVTGRWKT
jgi:hypothetical protein